MHTDLIHAKLTVALSPHSADAAAHFLVRTESHLDFLQNERFKYRTGREEEHGTAVQPLLGSSGNIALGSVHCACLTED